MGAFTAPFWNPALVSQSNISTCTLHIQMYPAPAQPPELCLHWCAVLVLLDVPSFGAALRSKVLAGHFTKAQATQPTSSNAAAAALPAEVCLTICPAWLVPGALMAVGWSLQRSNLAGLLQLLARSEPGRAPLPLHACSS